MEISELKARLCILDVARHLGIEYDPKTKKAICPFHDDKNPSLQFSKEKQIATCFSTNCDAGTMDIIDLTEKKLKVSKHDAIKWLSALAGELPKKKDETPKAKKPTPDYAKDFEQMRSTLLSSSTGRNYAISRKLDRRRVDMGFNPHTGKFGYLRGFLVFPLLDKQGKVVSLYGRNVRKNGTYRHHYTTDREGFYPCYPKQETERLILTECIIDAATLLSIPAISENYGILSLYGAKVCSEEQGEALQSLPFLKEIIFFLDGDEAGREGMVKQAKNLKALLPEVALTAVETLEGEDINSIAQSHEPAVFTQLLTERKPFSFPAENTGEASEKGTATGLKLDTSNPEKLSLTTENAIYMVMGGLPPALDTLKVMLHIVHPTSKARSRGRVELYEDRQVAKAARDAAEKLFLRADLIEQDMDILVDLVDAHREAKSKQKGGGGNEDGKPKPLTKMEHGECVSFLSLPRLMPRINELIGVSGIVGEKNNRICVFVIASSHKMPSTMHALIQGSSGSGKTHLLSSVIELMPPESTMCLTRVTEASLYNYGENELVGKLIGLEDYDGLEEKAELAFRELQSRGRLISSTSVKREVEGDHKGGEKRVNGPIASLAATTRGHVYEDNMSRCFLIAVDESQEQTLRIIKYQNDRVAGAIDKGKEKEAREFLRNCMRVLKPYEVVNPYANKIELPREAHKIRRLNDLFQSFVCQVTLLHQFQRQKDSKGRLVTEKEDIREAIDIMFESIVLKVDELDGSLRAFYEDLKAYVKARGKDYEFSQREVRQALKVSKTQMQRHINALLGFEYIKRAEVGIRNTFSYKISYWDNLGAMRARIRKGLEAQLENL